MQSKNVIIKFDANNNIIDGGKIELPAKVSSPDSSKPCKLDAFAKTFYRLKIGEKIIQDIAIPNSGQRSYTLTDL